MSKVIQAEEGAREQMVAMSSFQVTWLAILMLAFFPVMAQRASADDLQLKRRYFRLYMEYQNVEISGTVKERRENAGVLTHQFVLRYGAARRGRIPPMEVFTLRPNPGEPHVKDKLLVDEAFAMSDDFLNIQFRREYISSHRFDKFFGVSSLDETMNEPFSKALRFSNFYLYPNATSPPGIFYAIQQSVQMGLDGFDPKVYWGNESEYEKSTKFEILGDSEFLGFPCKRVRYSDKQGIVIDALIATEPSLQILDVLGVSDPGNTLPEDAKSIWMNLPKTESIKQFDRWLIRDRVTYKAPRVDWEVMIEDVKALPKDYEGLWATYNSFTGCHLTGPAEPQTRKGTSRVALKNSKGYTMVPYSDEEKRLITAYLEGEHRKLDDPAPSFLRMFMFAFTGIVVCLAAVYLVRRDWRGN